MTDVLLRPWLRRAVLLLVVALLAGCSDGDDAATPEPRSEPSPASGSPTPGTGPVPALADKRGPADPTAHAVLSPWRGCRGAFECATLTVPRDWGEVDGPTIDLAVIRQPATGDRIGSLVVNPGGPGASGRDFLASYPALPFGLDGRFDIVSWDPRGTGGSRRIDCTGDEEWLKPEIDPTPEDAADVEAIRQELRRGLDQCLDVAGDVLPFVGTRSTVRDLDALRGALGDEKLTYLGYSYGTAIGIDYLRLYPGRVRAMVLDGVLLPGADPVVDTHAQARAFERTLDAYLAGCAERPGCPLGDDPKATLLDLVDRLEDERLPASYALDTPGAAPREGTVGVGELYIAVAASLYTRPGWDALDGILAGALDDPAQAQGILQVRDTYFGRALDGSWDDDIDARVAVLCADQAARAAEPEGDDSDRAEEWGEELPFWGRWFAVGLPGCWGLPPAVEPQEPITDGPVPTTVPPVVFIGSTDDPATPYEQAEEARRATPGSRLVTYEGAEHTAYRRLTDCIDTPVTTYLLDLVPPEDGLRCPA